MLRGSRSLSEPERTLRTAPGTVSKTPYPARARLLVVDDELAIREWLRRALGALGYEVFEAADAPNAERVLQGSRVDCLILDLRLMGHSGLDILEFVRFRRDLSQMPVVILTGVSFLTEAEQETIRRHGAYVLYKPEAVDQIADLLTRIVKPRNPPLAGMS